VRMILAAPIPMPSIRVRSMAAICSASFLGQGAAAVGCVARLQLYLRATLRGGPRPSATS
jgi:hypothetical protein